MLITEMKAKETLQALATGKVFIINCHGCKEVYFPEAEAEAFWQSEKTRAKLGKWFDSTPRDLPIVIASASPEFELKHAAKILGVKTLIGTKCDMKTGALTGKNCKGAEKIARIREVIGEYEVRAMYTDDAKADGPLLAIAREKYIVTHGKVEKQK